MHRFLDLFLHLDKHLEVFVQEFGAWWVYATCFGIVFAETGLVVTPFLPGDSLLFALGALSGPADGQLHWGLMFVLLSAAAIIGDAVNYHLGRWIGPRVFASQDSATWWHRLFNRKHLERAHQFYERYGGKAVVLGRFVPVVRTFVPFVAGAGAMNYRQFVVYNVLGALLWVGACLGAGRLLADVPGVRTNFSVIVLGVVAISLLPIVVEVIRHRREARASRRP